MRIENTEKWVRRAGAVTGLVFLSLAYVGLWRGSRRQKGRRTGPSPAFLQETFFSYFLKGAAFFGLLYLLRKPLPIRLPVRTRAVVLILGFLPYFSGLALMFWGRLALGSMYGVSTSLGAQLYAGHRLVTTGPYARVRHPMYLGAQLAAMGALLIYRNWAALFAIIMSPGLALRARREEEALEAEFGEQGAQYHRRVPAWMPRLR